MKNNEPFTEHNLILLGKAPRQVEYIGHNYNTYKNLQKPRTSVAQSSKRHPPTTEAMGSSPVSSIRSYV